MDETEIIDEEEIIEDLNDIENIQAMFPDIILSYAYWRKNETYYHPQYKTRSFISEFGVKPNFLKVGPKGESVEVVSADLLITFVGRTSTYYYSELPIEVVGGLKTADSIGSYYNTKIKANYDSTMCDIAFGHNTDTPRDIIKILFGDIEVLDMDVTHNIDDTPLPVTETGIETDENLPDPTDIKNYEDGGVNGEYEPFPDDPMIDLCRERWSEYMVWRKNNPNISNLNFEKIDDLQACRLEGFDRDWYKKNWPKQLHIEEEELDWEIQANKFAQVCKLSWIKHIKWRLAQKGSQNTILDPASPYWNEIHECISYGYDRDWFVSIGAYVSLKNDDEDDIETEFENEGV